MKPRPICRAANEAAGFSMRSMGSGRLLTRNASAIFNQTLAEEQGAEKKLRVIAAGLLKAAPVEA
jgi:hypothetical protein